MVTHSTAVRLAIVVALTWGVALHLPHLTHGQAAMHSVQKESFRAPVKTESEADALPIDLRLRSATYANGLGKTIETVQAHASPDGKDIVTPVVYDGIGRSTTSWMPYVASEGSGRFYGAGTGAVEAFYSAPPNGVTPTNHPKARSVLEDSPLERVREAGAVGADWQPYDPSIPYSGHTTKTHHGVNEASTVMRFSVEGGLLDGSLIYEGYYEPGTLYKTMITDPNGDISVTYTDRDKQEIAKVSYDGSTKVMTYYMYDRYGRLRYVLPPRAEAAFHANPTQGQLDGLVESWATKYVYDAYGRQIEKHMPEEDVVDTIYDRLGRVILRQDGIMRENGDWLFTKYDQYGRTVMTGIYHNPSIEGRVAMQEEVYAQIGSITPYHERPATPADTDQLYGYTNQVFPREDPATQENELYVWTVSYYDDYDFDGDGADDVSFEPVASFSNSPTVETTSSSTLHLDGHMPFYRLTGETTRQLVRVLDGTSGVFTGDREYSSPTPSSPNTLYYKGTVRLKPGFKTQPGQTVYIGPDITVPNQGTSGGEERWIASTTFYDKKGRAIQTQREGLYSTDVSSTQYTFDGRLRRTQAVHERTDGAYVVGTSTSFTVTTKTDYDHAGRPVRAYQKNGTDPEVVVSEQVYNALGEPTQTRQHSTDGGQTFAQTVATERNVRGWMTQKTVTATSGTSLFEMDWYYTLSILDAEARYDGSISSMRWSTTGILNRHAYAYQYDGLGRLASALYNADRGTNGTNLHTGRYDLTAAYDLNGNLTSLVRKGITDPGAGSGSYSTGTIDNLSYHYHGGGNQLTNVTDASGSGEGFVQNGYASGTDAAYTYDRNGNLLEDRHKGLSVAYSYLNLPERIDFGSGNEIRWLFAASGQKLRRQVVTGSTVVETKEYAGGFVYRYDGSPSDGTPADGTSGGSGEVPTLDYFQMASGRVKYAAQGGTLAYQYRFTDHLGGTRLLYEPGASAGTLGRVVQAASYYPYGLQMAGLQAGSGDRPNEDLYHGKELTDAHGLGWYHYGARFYDVATARWTTMDPLDEFHSPYSYVGGDPVNLTDPDGMASSSPIYDRQGNFLGTDDQGLQGEAIVMDAGDFTQGMSHADARRVGSGIGSVGYSIADKIQRHMQGLKERPDYDGFVTDLEGIAWALAHPGALDNPTPDNSLYIDASQLDFGVISTYYFREEGVKTPINLFHRGNMLRSRWNSDLYHTVYALGRVDMILINRSTHAVSIVNNDATDYDWNLGEGDLRFKQKLRNALLRNERLQHGLGDEHGFKAYYYGTGTLRY